MTYQDLDKDGTNSVVSLDEGLEKSAKNVSLEMWRLSIDSHGRRTAQALFESQDPDVQRVIKEKHNNSYRAAYFPPC
ncbi:hypothetical protein COU59_01490 [Candidatus Pacearchaeota archaeon CG10_big_fil_rev_8_21_14_0_10_34_12]|nr:MAG: hypothetical protein COU59_01490 [Candidatus Pacearchaeota archaeon CG10_big_fil_rev_8_21_14_0_10_34_12]